MKKFAILVAALLSAAACENVDTDGIRPEDENVETDSLVTVLTPPAGLRNLDILVYGSKGLKKLVASRRIEWPETSVRMLLPEGEMELVAVGNLPYTLNLSTLSQYDAVSKLQIDYFDEDPLWDVVSGEMRIRAGDSCSLALSPVLVEISLKEVSQKFAAPKRLENPIVYLDRAARFCEIFRSTGFSPAETTDDTLGMRRIMWDQLPYDVGFYPQHPCTKLYCYPNDSGPNPTRLVLEGSFDKTRVKFPVELSGLKKGASYSVSIDIGETPDKYDFSLECNAE